MFAVRKPSPITPCRLATAEPARLVDRLADLVRTCGRLFGLSLFGVDCLETPAGPLVMEVNDFPNYTAVPDADQRLASHALGAAAAFVSERSSVR